MRSAVVVCVLAAATTPAHADCAQPHWVGTAPGDVPTNGSLYIERGYVARGDEPNEKYEWIGKPGRVHQTVLAHDIIRLDYEGEEGSTLVLFPHHQRSEYRLSSGWRAPAGTPRVVEYEHYTSDSYEGSTDALVVTVDQATAAVRATWTPEKGGNTAVWWVVAPHHSVRGYTLSLGDHACGGRRTLPPDDLRDGGHLALTAIRLDGSEVAIAGLPERISTGMSPTSQRILFIVCGLLACLITGVLIAWRVRARKGTSA